MASCVRRLIWRCKHANVEVASRTVHLGTLRIGVGQGLLQQCSALPEIQKQK